MAKNDFQTLNEIHVCALNNLLSSSVDKDSVAKSLMTLREEKGNIAEIIRLFSKKFPFEDKQKKLLSVAANMAAELNKNEYHGNVHSLEVASGAIMLGNKALKEGSITLNQYCLLVVGALIHDYKHDGKNNAGQQFLLEQLAFDSAKERLKKAGASINDMQLIEAIVLCTDISKDFSDSDAMSPADTLKKYLVDGAQDRQTLHPKLQVLHDFKAGDLAQMLQDSDVGIAMCSPQYFDLESFYLAKEMGSIEKDATDYDRSSRLGFFIPQLMHGGRFFSEQGQKLMTSWVEDVISFYKEGEQKKSFPLLKL